MHRRAIILTIGLVTTVALTTFTPLSLARLRVNLPLHEASPPSYSVYMPVILRNG